MKLFINSTIKIVHTVPWSNYPNQNVFSDHQNLDRMLSAPLSIIA